MTVNCFCLITLLCINKWAGPVYGPYLPRSCVLCKHAVVRWTLSTLHAAAADSVCVDARAVWLFTRLSHASTRWGRARGCVVVCVFVSARSTLCLERSEIKTWLLCARAHLGSRVCLCTMRARHANISILLPIRVSCVSAPACMRSVLCQRARSVFCWCVLCLRSIPLARGVRGCVCRVVLVFACVYARTRQRVETDDRLTYTSLRWAPDNTQHTPLGKRRSEEDPRGFFDSWTVLPSSAVTGCIRNVSVTFVAILSKNRALSLKLE